MGAFQAIASGIGQMGQDIGTGEALAKEDFQKSALLKHTMEQDRAKQALAELTQKQNYGIAQQQNELFKQQMIQSGWQHAGTVKNASGQYETRFYNPRNGEIKVMPHGGGVPPDSFEAKFSNYKALIEQVADMKKKGVDVDIDNMEAFRAAFGMGGQPRDPVAQLSAYAEWAKTLNGRGMKTVNVPGIGNVDITTPAGQANYAQQMMVSGPRLMYQMANQANRDLTGFTAGERRELATVQAMIAPNLKAAEDEMTKRLAGIEAYQPGGVEKIHDEAAKARIRYSKPYNDLINEIRQRHGLQPIKYDLSEPIPTPKQPQKEEEGWFDRLFSSSPANPAIFQGAALTGEGSPEVISPPQAATSTPKKGETREHNGATYMFDGEKWVKQAGK